MSTKLSGLPDVPDVKVYVSSTFTDLEEYRSAVITALRKMEGIKTLCMEDYVSED
ncbi:MAG: DUF4062 domain-containing protein [Nitrospirae bacterium]|nr:DUF4062 domain-containing protein [Nitrospirota bacterium]